MTLPKTEDQPPKTGWFSQLGIILEMIKIEHTVFALPFAFMGALLGARGLPTASQALWILVAMAGARSAAMAFNRLVDAHYDALNPRTWERALPVGLITPGATKVFIGASALIFFLAAGQLNCLALILSPLALGWVLLYSYTKRFTWGSHLVLGMALGIAPAAGWIAVRGEIGAVPLVLSAAVLLWVAGFDILYALQDEAFDRQVGLHSIPCRFGPVWALRLARLCHLGAAVGFVMVGRLAGLGMIYGAAAALTAGLLLVEHCLVSPRDLSRLNQAFFAVNGVIGIVLGLATLFSLWP